MSPWSKVAEARPRAVGAVPRPISRIAIGAAAAAIAVPLAGCHQAAIVLSQPEVRSALANVSAAVLTQLVVPAIARAMNPPGASASPAASAVRNAPPATAVDVDSVARSAISGAAASVPGASTSSAGEVSFTCRRGEDRASCIDRFRAEVHGAVQARAEPFAQAYADCHRTAFEYTPQATGYLQSSDVRNDCLVTRGFGAEVAALDPGYLTARRRSS